MIDIWLLRMCWVWTGLVCKSFDCLGQQDFGSFRICCTGNAALLSCQNRCHWVTKETQTNAILQRTLLESSIFDWTPVLIMSNFGPCDLADNKLRGQRRKGPRLFQTPSFPRRRLNKAPQQKPLGVTCFFYFLVGKNTVKRLKCLFFPVFVWEKLLLCFWYRSNKSDRLAIVESFDWRGGNPTEVVVVHIGWMTFRIYF